MIACFTCFLIRRGEQFDRAKSSPNPEWVDRIKNPVADFTPSEGEFATTRSDSP